MLSKIVTIIQSIKLLADVVQRLLDYLEERKIRKVEAQVEQQNSAVASLNAKIKAEAEKESPDDEIIKDLHRRLNNISRRV